MIKLLEARETIFGGNIRDPSSYSQVEGIKNRQTSTSSGQTRTYTGQTSTNSGQTSTNTSVAGI